jgi:hypothetical protein
MLALAPKGNCRYWDMTAPFLLIQCDARKLAVGVFIVTVLTHLIGTIIYRHSPHKPADTILVTLNRIIADILVIIRRLIGFSIFFFSVGCSISLGIVPHCVHGSTIGHVLVRFVVESEMLVPDHAPIHELQYLLHQSNAKLSSSASSVNTSYS